MKKRTMLAIGVAPLIVAMAPAALATPADPIRAILTKVNQIHAIVRDFCENLGGLSQNWDKSLPANDPGGACPSNSSRFTCVFDGEAVRDNHTGLVWEQAPLTITHTWRLGIGGDGTLGSARAECVERTTGGQRGWRLPSVHELASLIDPAQTTPGLPALSAGHPFANIQTGPKGYWSATTDADGANVAWAVNFNGGGVGGGDKTVTSHVWCVRGGMNADQY